MAFWNHRAWVVVFGRAAAAGPNVARDLRPFASLTGSSGTSTFPSE